MKIFKKVLSGVFAFIVLAGVCFGKVGRIAKPVVNVIKEACPKRTLPILLLLIMAGCSKSAKEEKDWSAEPTEDVIALAKKGDAEAQAELENRYSNDNGEELNLGGSYNWHKNLAYNGITDTLSIIKNNFSPPISEIHNITPNGNDETINEENVEEKKSIIKEAIDWIKKENIHKYIIYSILRVLLRIR